MSCTCRAIPAMHIAPRPPTTHPRRCRYYQQALKLSAMSSNSLAEKYGLSQHIRVFDNDVYVVRGFDWVDAEGRTIFDAIR